MKPEQRCKNPRNLAKIMAKVEPIKEAKKAWLCGYRAEKKANAERLIKQAQEHTSKNETWCYMVVWA